MPFPLVAAIAAGAQLLGSGINSMASGKMNRRTMRYNKEMYKQQRADSLADWNMNNAYNSPDAQMQRFKDAGLNPNLIYGQMSEASPVRGTEAKSWNPDVPTVDLGGAAKEGILAYQDNRMKDAQIDNLTAQNANILEDTKLKEKQGLVALVSAALSQSNVDLNKQQLKEKEGLMANLFEASTLGLEKQKAEIENVMGNTQFTKDSNVRAEKSNAQTIAESIQRVAGMRIQNAKTQAEIDNVKLQSQNLIKQGMLSQMDIDLKKLGIQPTDNMLMRMAARLLNGEGWNDVLKAIKTKGISNF